MLDQKWIRGDLDDLASRLLKKGFELDAAYLSSAEQERKASQTQMETLQSERNRSSKAIGQANAKGEDIEPLLAEVATLGERLELKGFGFTPGSHQRIIGFVCSVRYVFIGEIRNGCEINLQFARYSLEFSFFCLEPFS